MDPTAWTPKDVVTAVAAGIALLLSLISIGWQVLTWRRSGPRLVVEAGRANIANTTYRDALTIRITNVGRAATTVRRCYFHEAGGTRWTDASGLAPDRKNWPTTPLRLEPEASAFFSMSAQDARTALVGGRPGDEVWLRAVAEYGNRRARSGRQRVKMVYLQNDFRRGKPAGRWKRFRQRLRPQWFSMLAGFVPGRKGQFTDQYAVQVNNLGWLPFWRLRVFAASDQLPQMSDEERQVLKRSAYRRLLLFRGQTWYLVVPEDLQDLAGRYTVWFRPAKSLSGVSVPDRRTVDEHRQHLRGPQ